ILRQKIAENVVFFPSRRRFSQVDALFSARRRPQTPPVATLCNDCAENADFTDFNVGVVAKFSQTPTTNRRSRKTRFPTKQNVA
ncbi:MAG: hypothetical protein IKY61_07540, partial [Thermoguttaceae bacterium]|nr:hypothetical protein [Thermoguttaceae bacterium]